MNGNKAILLVEDYPDDEALTLRALKKNNILNEVTVACDGANVFVRKPVSFSDLATAMNAIGMFWLDLNEVAAN